MHAMYCVSKSARPDRTARARKNRLHAWEMQMRQSDCLILNQKRNTSCTS
jgi:hypothetical protein